MSIYAMHKSTIMLRWNAIAQILSETLLLYYNWKQIVKIDTVMTLSKEQGHGTGDVYIDV